VRFRDISVSGFHVCISPELNNTSPSCHAVLKDPLFILKRTVSLELRRTIVESSFFTMILFDSYYLLPFAKILHFRLTFRFWRQLHEFFAAERLRVVWDRPISLLGTQALLSFDSHASHKIGQKKKSESNHFWKEPVRIAGTIFHNRKGAFPCCVSYCGKKLQALCH
jgi:hypothetical protein